MNLTIVEIDITRRANALQTLANELCAAMKLRWPKIDFYDDIWPLKSEYKTKIGDISFGPAIASFKGRDSAYILALRCLAAKLSLEGKVASWALGRDAWRLLATRDAPLMTLRRIDLCDLEQEIVSRATPVTAGPDSGRLLLLARQIDELSRCGVIDRLTWSTSPKARSRLRKLALEHRHYIKKARASILDRQIEAFSEVTSAMLAHHPNIDEFDRTGIAAANILMLAPSRVNEVLCLGVNDRFTIEDYSKRAEDRQHDSLHSTHQLLLMKGSKGAAWSPKPILNFMINLANECWQILLENGKRSRMLVKWYEDNPNKLYLPPELENLRGEPVSLLNLCKILNLTNAEPRSKEIEGVRVNFWAAIVNDDTSKFKAEVLKIPNPRKVNADGRRNSQSEIIALPWAAIERLALHRIGERMKVMRKVTSRARYHGKLSEMLMLVDKPLTPYLPQALTDDDIRNRLKTTATRKRQGASPSVFIKLGLRMVQDDREVDCYLEPHDPRRWLTTQALGAKERLSDVLINKWANRITLNHLSAYDLRSEKQKADQATAPLPDELVEISAGLQVLEGLETRYGLSSEIVVAHGEEISITGTEAVFHATDRRPVARTGNQIIILYPTRFGICLHQHHEIPCRAYDCVGCNDQLVVKGHLPTNSEWRKEANLANRSIVNQLRALIIARNRAIADDPQALDAHLLTLVKEGLDPTAMATDLIQKFHDIKDQVRDLHFRNELERAFIAAGIVEQLNSTEIVGGALIKYHALKRHASPGHERALETHFSSREEMERLSEIFYQKHPELAPQPLELQDERHKLNDEGLDWDELDNHAA